MKQRKKAGGYGYYRSQRKQKHTKKDSTSLKAVSAASRRNTQAHYALAASQRTSNHGGVAETTDTAKQQNAAVTFANQSVAHSEASANPQPSLYVRCSADKQPVLQAVNPSEAAAVPAPPAKAHQFTARARSSAAEDKIKVSTSESHPEIKKTVLDSHLSLGSDALTNSISKQPMYQDNTFASAAERDDERNAWQFDAATNSMPQIDTLLGIISPTPNFHPQDIKETKRHSLICQNGKCVSY